MPNEDPPPLRAKYVRMAEPVNKLMQQLYDAGKVIIIPTEMARRVRGVHFSATHWAVKKGKVWGRPIGDASATEGNSCPLNCERVKELVTELWGPIEHPTVKKLAAMVIRQAERVGWDNLVLWKMDLRGAFTLLYVEKDSVKKLAFQLTDGLTLLYIVGMFGWTGMPAAFQVVTRILKRLINAELKGECEMYVDDLLGACSIAEVLGELAIAKAKCEALLGPDAVEESKTSWGRQSDWIGWMFNVETRKVSIARHNFLKTLHGFMSFDVTKPVTVGQVNRLASWAARYSAICRALQPFTKDLFNEIKGRTRMNATFILSASATRTVHLWRAYLVLLELQHSVYSRPICSLAMRAVKYVIEYDASLTGIGLILSRVDPANGTLHLMKVAKVVLPYSLGEDSGFQNSVEFIAVVVGMGCLGALGISNAAIRIIGDNTSSLSWSVRCSFRDGPSRSAAMCFVAIGNQLGLEVTEGDHIAGKVNIKCDGLSRGKTPRELGFKEEDCMDIEEYDVLRLIVEACNPRRDTNLGGGFEEVWALTQKISDMFKV